MSSTTFDFNAFSAKLTYKINKQDSYCTKELKNSLSAQSVSDLISIEEALEIFENNPEHWVLSLALAEERIDLSVNKDLLELSILGGYTSLCYTLKNSKISIECKNKHHFKVVVQGQEHF